jgi:hypothetical protein
VTHATRSKAIFDGALGLLPDVPVKDDLEGFFLIIIVGPTHTFLQSPRQPAGQQAWYADWLTRFWCNGPPAQAASLIANLLAGQDTGQVPTATGLRSCRDCGIRYVRHAGRHRQRRR